MNLLAILLAAQVLVTSSHAATLISFLNQPTDTFDGFNDTAYRQAVDFRTSTSQFIVTSASLGLFNADSIDHTLTLSLYTDILGHPGNLVGTFDTNILISPTGSGPESAQVYTVTDAGMLLAGDTIYWLVAQMNQNFSTNTVHYTAVNNNTPDAESLYSAVSATSNLISLDSGSSWVNSFGGNRRYSLTGFSVPEPSRTLLIGLSVATMLIRRSRASANSKAEPLS